MLKFIWSYLKSYVRTILILALCSILIAVIDLLAPYLTARFIDEILITGDTSKFYGFILILLIIGAFALISYWFSVILSTKMRLNVTNRLIGDLIRHVQRLRSECIFNVDMIYFAKRIDRDANDIISFAVGSMIEICINLAMLIMANILLIDIGVKWEIIFIVIAAIHVMVYGKLRTRLFERSTAVRETDSNYFTDISDNFLYIYSIKIHSLYDEYIAKFRASFEKFLEALISETKISFWFNTSSMNANETFKVLIFLIGGLDVLNGDMKIGNFVALNGYYIFAMRGVAYFMNLGQNYQNALAAYARLMEIKNMPVETNGIKILDNINSIGVENISYSFGEQSILTNFSKTFERGKIYCIVGKNGSGKSTLINLICGLLSPISGTVNYNGIPIREVDMISARKDLIAVVEQKDFLKNDNLSGGERRKLSIGMAISKGGDVLIMDEPDNNLDAAAIVELIDRIKFNKHNRITIIISHDERIIEIADEVINF